MTGKELSELREYVDTALKDTNEPDKMNAHLSHIRYRLSVMISNESLESGVVTQKMLECLSKHWEEWTNSPEYADYQKVEQVLSRIGRKG